MSNNDFEIENGVLKKYHGLGGNVVIPDGVTAIGERAFAGYRSLRSITIPHGVTEIGFEAFIYCDMLGSVTIPNSVKLIEEGAFGSCRQLCHIFFVGTKEEWFNVELDDSWNIDPEFDRYNVQDNPPTGDIIVHCTDGEHHEDDPYRDYYMFEEVTGSICYFTYDEYNEYCSEHAEDEDDDED